LSSTQFEPKKKNRDHPDSEDSARPIFIVTQRFLWIPETKILLGPQEIELSRGVGA